MLTPLSLLMLLLGELATTPHNLPAPLAEFLSQSIGLTPDELVNVGNGKLVMKALPSADSREITIFGIVSVSAPREFYIERVADFRTSLSAPKRVFGVYSEPATSEDMANIALSHDEVEDLAHCEPGSCLLKLPSAVMAEVRAEMAGTPGSPDSVVNRMFRTHVAEYVTAYRARGNAALVEYEDQPVRTSAAKLFEDLLSRSQWMYQYAPALETYLKNYPQDRPEGVRETIYWSQDDMPHMKRIFSVRHVVVYAPPELPNCTLIASKQLYADHYLDGAFDVTAVVDQGQVDSKGFYLLVLERYHFDRLSSGGPLNIRGRATEGLRDRAASMLERTRAAIEKAWAGSR